ncbi:hypothetical protein [Devosia aquimaris]|uniref:hypothetical protein n=1 Tax=Devosia aquimaris TaxID=2866214 RepID=UPI001CD04C1D|nr:hypothetical protein [Devosia sp. CJK-A8-3]
MKRVLIVEDNIQKANAITFALKAAFGELAYILLVNTVSVAMVVLTAERWDGVVLDLSFQRASGMKEGIDRPQLAGVKVLQQLDEMRIGVPVLIATQHSSFVDTEFGDFHSVHEVATTLEEIFTDNLRGVVEVDLSSTEWQPVLTDLASRFF